MKEFVTPRQVARAIGVSESSLKRWCDKGLLTTVRTAGGHRRLRMNVVLEFVRQTHQQVVRPELLGLPSTTGRGDGTIERACGLLKEALVAGDEEQSRRIVLDLYLASHSVRDICDHVIARAFHNIGDEWQCGSLEVYQERRACELTARVLYEVRSALPSVQPNAAEAIGGTLSGDPYQLPTLMAELVLRELGWRADSYGTCLPVATLCAALKRTRPRLCWISVSHIESLPAFFADYAHLYQTAQSLKVALIVGGQALTKPIRRQMQYSAYCDNLRHLVSFAESLAPR